MLHSRPLGWEVVDSYTVDPVRVYLEEEGAVITRIASHEIVGDYTFDMARPAQSTSPRKAGVEGHNSHPRVTNQTNPRRRASLPERSAKVDCFGYLSRHQPRFVKPFDWRFPLRRASFPGPVTALPPREASIASANPANPTNTVTTATAGRRQPQQRLTQRLTTFSFLKLHRRPGTSPSSSESESESASDGNSPLASGTLNSPKPPIPGSPSAKRSPRSPRSPNDLTVNIKSHGYKKSDLKKAIVFARGELMKQVEKSGQNALILEGWTATVFRQEERYRIQVVYTGRPALVDTANTMDIKRRPPFLRVIEPEL